MKALDYILKIFNLVSLEFLKRPLFYFVHLQKTNPDDDDCMNRKFKIFLLSLAAISGAALYWVIYHPLIPLSTVHLQFNRKEIVEKADSLLHQWGYDIEKIEPFVRFEGDRKLLQYIESEYAQHPDLQRWRKKVPIYSWAVTWNIKEALDSLVSETDFEKIVIWLDTGGNSLGFRVTMADDSTAKNLSLPDARAKADSVLGAMLAHERNEYEFSRVNQHSYDHRTDYFFHYLKSEPVAGIKPQIEIGIQGNTVGRFERHWPVSQMDSSSRDMVFNEIPFLVVLLAMVALYLIFSIGKLRADGLSFKYASPFAILMGIITALNVWMSFSSQWSSTINLLVSMAIGSIFIALFVLVAVACTDAIVREVWDDKLLTLDTLRRGRIFHRLFGNALLRGLAMAGIMLGCSALIFKLFSQWGPLDFNVWSTKIDVVNAWNPFLSAILNTLSSSIWLQMIATLFLVTILAKYIGHHLWIIGIVALVWGVGFGQELEWIAAPYYLRFLYWALFGGVSAWLILRYDLLTALIFHIGFFLWIEVVRLWYLQQHTLLVSSLVIITFIVIMILIALWASRKEISREELLEFTPTYVNKILERERLKRELEIARRVQLSFLPRKEPENFSMSIAHTCLPALDVGGDYYDFIPLDEDRLGMAIGDVSGKGISAAFYMTLTKGFLRSLTKSIDHPRQVLSECNRLFYENVERGHFISMIYGIFDFKNMSFTFARAGHNPVIAHLGDYGEKLLYPAGIALGLESGPIFDRVIREETVSFLPNDMFVFYTDGFSEAMNSVNNEFGEDRLYRLLSHGKELEPKALLTRVVDSVKQFMGKAAQHDDMTMVIVRIQ
ncbi:SpoIIE family protein phosphatase [candidate division KSB1 bacterium]|nr:SpoIIE family protein phosphatase [candidate division KSB1 bacterium]